jgi:hypothetical protein
MSYEPIYERHGEVGKRLYKTWGEMKTRCRNPKNRSYARYGGRGISVCSRWLEYNNFAEDMGERPEGTTLDRIDNNGDYEPSNCKWSTPKEQASNRQSNKWIELDGKVKTLCEWADELGINRTTVIQRINAYNWTVEEALRTPTRQNRRRILI